MAYREKIAVHIASCSLRFVISNVDARQAHTHTSGSDKVLFRVCAIDSDLCFCRSVLTVYAA